MSGVSNILGDINRNNLVSGSQNTLGNRTEDSVVLGADNDLCLLDTSSVTPACLAGGASGLSGADPQTDMSIIGSGNITRTIGEAGSHVKILGDQNAVLGDDSGWNVITGHNATVNGTGNFVAGGNATTGATVTGNDNVVIGAGASSTVSDAVAIGSGSAATLSRTAAQAAYTGNPLGGTFAGGILLSEGTDATLSLIHI